jgi:hypothetical protein
MRLLLLLQWLLVLVLLILALSINTALGNTSQQNHVL